MISVSVVFQTLLVFFSCVAAMPSGFPRVYVPQQHFEVLQMRASTSVNPDAVTGVTCQDRSQNIVFHDQNVAELGICGGIAGAITKCGGAPTSTVGQSGTAKFSLNAVDSGATINISKGRWEQCIRAARAVCPTGSMSGTCVGGASTGNVAFTLANP
ncbi:hypothetical protein UCRPA7_6591 [Phaeoacremonium minimum UCRPA7]|uniref:Uncharacterized protein n=1 Tax=Phaeoacremonium minimum (strain UCR-PA7) TaxID=1286976 RepID=R8BFA5_PHAM7|nr:hypothetical protein UCRPA7_6591 [Phaeoacremonium minimum UCRPA7]EON97986.1 hypothetical protein UCRPA7_6591 [Phaeoacremonium minimum UCRPA7]